MKRLSTALIALLVLFCTSDLVLAQRRASAPAKKQERPAAANNVPSIEGTTWAGTDSDGDFYEFTFLKGGQLRYRTNTSRPSIVSFEDKGDVWAQNGQLVMILIGDTSTRLGNIVGNRIEGKAWNTKESRWTWSAKKK